MSEPDAPKAPIIGYRELSDQEIAGLNNVKTVANLVGELIQECRDAGEELDQRWVSIAQTQLQQGFMALNRSIAKPESF